MAEFTFDFEDTTWEDVEESRKRKQVTRESAAIVKQWLSAFHESSAQHVRYVWNTLPAPVIEAYEPRKSDKGDRTIGGFQAIVRKIKDFQDELDVYPVPMNDIVIHEMMGDIDANDPKYGGFFLVRKQAWKDRNKAKQSADEPTTPTTTPAKQSKQAAA